MGHSDECVYALYSEATEPIISKVVIIAMTQFLHLLLSRIRQPRVIAEIIGGVLLGPTVREIILSLFAAL